jgi:hypothetical protein
VQFGVSPFPAGVLAFSRILSDQEVLIVANTNTQRDFQGEVIVDASLNAQGTPYRVFLSNKNNARQPGNVMPKAGGSVEIQEPEGGVTHGPVHVVRVDVQPMEVQFLRKA